MKRILLTGWLLSTLVLTAAHAQTTLPAMSPSSSKPPVAALKPKSLVSPHGTRTDNYYWLNERENPAVIDYLNAENAYFEQQMAPVKKLEEQLFQEMKGRIKEQDESVPYRDNGYYYASRYAAGAEYPVYTRRQGSLQAPEQVLLDANALGKGRPYFAVGGLSVSDNNQVLAFSTDTVSRRLYTLRFRDLKTGKLYPEKIPNTEGPAVWAADNKTVFYAKKDVTTLLPYQLMRHTLGTDPAQDVVVYEEKDNTFGLYVSRTKSKRFILLTLGSSLSSEIRYLDAARPTAPLQVFLPREADHLYEIQDFGDQFYVRTNWQAPNFRVMRTPLAAPAKASWQNVVPARPDVFVEEMEIFKNFLVLNERKNGLLELRVINWKSGQDHYLKFDEPAYTATIGVNREFDTPVLRYNYTSLTTPNSVFDYDMNTCRSTLRKEQTVLGGFNRADYVTERVLVPARDGKQIPMAIVYRKGFKKDGRGPVLQYAYGSYGVNMDPTFSSARLSLLDRGFAYALCNIRGGQELGRQWFEDGRMGKKINSFNDFIDCSEYLIKQQYTSPARLFANGGSAGGLLMGAVLNMRPDLYKGVIAAVPFVDVVTTMSDASIPLTTGEYDQWGNPADKASYDYMLSYSPYDQVRAQAYPNILVTTGLHDSQVQYFEPAKWVAKLRTLKTDQNKLLLHTDMSAGHGGASGRFQSLHDAARNYAFLLLLLNER